MSNIDGRRGWHTEQVGTLGIWALARPAATRATRATRAVENCISIVESIRRSEAWRKRQSGYNERGEWVIREAM